jgi:hypothetical protein
MLVQVKMENDLSYAHAGHEYADELPVLLIDIFRAVMKVL